MVRSYPYSDFARFLATISPLKTQGILADRNVFRGESISTYTLLPSVLRTTQTSCMGQYPIVNNFTETKDFVLHEHSLLEQFCIVANNSGLVVPNNFSNILRANQPIFGATPFPWLTRDVESLAALAQHYGIPTRCLDWSQDIYTAIYFAAMGACRRIQKRLMTGEEPFEGEGHFVIWVLEKWKLDRWPYPIRFIVPPYHQNPNLQAQRGVLTYWQMEYDQNHANQVIDRTPIDELLKSYWLTQGSTRYPPNSFPLEKHLIPITECVKAFYAVRNLGYTASKLFPGYAGAAQELEEEHILSDLKRNIPHIFQS